MAFQQPHLARNMAIVEQSDHASGHLGKLDRAQVKKRLVKVEGGLRNVGREWKRVTVGVGGRKRVIEKKEIKLLANAHKHTHTHTNIREHNSLLKELSKTE